MLTFLGLIAPIFFIVVGIEYLIGKASGKEYYRYADAIANMNAGIAERLFDFFYAILMLFIFKWVYDNFAIFDIPQTPAMWLLCLIIYDFMYYWYHRTGHEANFLWAVHIVHHQSEEYNFTVGSRQSGLQAIARTFFLSVLPLLGFVPEFAWTVFILGGSYQFFLHTKIIPKLGFLEYIFVTPSLHRVHHGRNEIYLDKNYGGIFIWWDMLFGTYQTEQEDIKYGITTGLPSKNVYWAIVHYWVDLFKQAGRIRKWTDKIKLFFMKPGWVPDYVEKKPLDFKKILERPKYDPQVPFQLGVYIFIQLFLSTLLLSGMLIQKGDVKNGYESLQAFYTEFMTPTELVVFTVLLTMSTLTVPVLFEKKNWAYYTEQVRLLLMAIGVPVLIYPALFDLSTFTLDLSVWNPFISLIIGTCAAMSFWLYRMRPYFGVESDEVEKNKQVEVQPIMTK